MQGDIFCTEKGYFYVSVREINLHHMTTKKLSFYDVNCKDGYAESPYSLSKEDGKECHFPLFSNPPS